MTQSLSASFRCLTESPGEAVNEAVTRFYPLGLGSLVMRGYVPDMLIQIRRSQAPPGAASNDAVLKCMMIATYEPVAP